MPNEGEEVYTQGLCIVGGAEPVRRHAASLAGVWGEPSPPVPTEARPNLGPAARVRETSQPGAEGARRGRGGGERGVVDFSRALGIYEIVVEQRERVKSRIATRWVSQRCAGDAR